MLQGLNPPEKWGGWAENFEVLYFLEAEVLWNFRMGLFFSGDLYLLGIYVSFLAHKL